MDKTHTVSYYDEMGDGQTPRAAYAEVDRWIRETGLATLAQRSLEAETIFRKVGITFNVYDAGGDPERLIPFDLIPRVFSKDEWHMLSAGIEQRAKALNKFIWDIYHDRNIIRDGILPESLITGNPAYQPSMEGFDPPGGVYSHIVGIDLVRTGNDDFFVLEDNCRTPSGVSYMLENREIMMRMFPDLFESMDIAPVESYPNELVKTLHSVKPKKCTGKPTVAVLSPGPMNSAYYEHCFLADCMGVEVVEGPDLFVDDGLVYMRTTCAPQRVDVLYRRIDDDFIDPEHFNPESVLGVPGLMQAYLTGGVTLVSAPGAGIADDKAIYTYVPDMIDYYLNETPILANVPTWKCADPADLQYVLENMQELVVKEVHGSGGKGLIVGPHASSAELEAFATLVKAQPSAYIAQPTLALSTCPTLIDEQLGGRHVDLRPFALVGNDRTRLVPGGLTRVAMREGSLVVNSSQGGGVKDTWVLEK